MNITKCRWSIRQLLLVNEPEELRCLAVLIGEHGVFLPGVSDPLKMDELADRFAERRDENQRLDVTLNGKSVPWPNQAMYFLD
jgi:hypothetical protein